MKLLRYFVILLTFPLFLFGELQLPDKHPLDETEYKKFILDNGLKVILVSNPKYNISAASMNVKVGSLSDPEDAQGKIIKPTSPIMGGIPTPILPKIIPIICLRSSMKPTKAPWTAFHNFSLLLRLIPNLQSGRSMR